MFKLLIYLVEIDRYYFFKPISIF